MHERKQRMVALADAVIALPGGYGTFEELLEIITWRQLGLYDGTVIILNTAGYYDSLLTLFGRAVEEHFMSPEHLTLWHVAASPEEAIRILYDSCLV